MNVMENYSFAILLLSLLKETPESEYSGFFRVPFVLDQENFEKLIDNLGGCTLKVPTREEIDEYLEFAMYYKYRTIDKLGPAKALKKLCIPRNKKDEMEFKLYRAKQELSGVLNLEVNYSD